MSNKRFTLFILILSLLLWGCSEVKPKKNFSPKEILKKYSSQTIPSIANSFQAEEAEGKAWVRFRCRESATDVYLQQNNLVGRQAWKYEEGKEPPSWLDGPKWWGQGFPADNKYEVGTGEINGHKTTVIIDTTLIDVWVISLLFEKP